MNTILMWKLSFKESSDAHFFADMYEEYVEGIYRLSSFCNVLFIETDEHKYQPIFKCLGDYNRHFKKVRVELKEILCEERWSSDR